MFDQVADRVNNIEEMMCETSHRELLMETPSMAGGHPDHPSGKHQ